MALRQIGRRNTEPGGRPGGEVGDQHIGTVQQAMQQVEPGLGFQIERHRFLTAVSPNEVRGKTIDDIVIVPGEVSTLGVFHFDDPRTEIGEHPRAHRRGDRLLQGHHGDPRQRPTGL